MSRGAAVSGWCGRPTRSTSCLMTRTRSNFGGWPIAWTRIPERFPDRCSQAHSTTRIRMRGRSLPRWTGSTAPLAKHSEVSSRVVAARSCRFSSRGCSTAESIRPPLPIPAEPRAHRGARTPSRLTRWRNSGRITQAIPMPSESGCRSVGNLRCDRPPPLVARRRCAELPAVSGIRRENGLVRTRTRGADRGMP